MLRARALDGLLRGLEHQLLECLAVGGELRALFRKASGTPWTPTTTRCSTSCGHPARRRRSCGTDAYSPSPPLPLRAHSASIRRTAHRRQRDRDRRTAQPVPGPSTRTVRYVDRLTTEQLRAEYPDGNVPLVPVDLEADVGLAPVICDERPRWASRAERRRAPSAKRGSRGSAGAWISHLTAGHDEELLTEHSPR
jgi:hypothetical protein